MKRSLLLGLILSMSVVSAAVAEDSDRPDNLVGKKIDCAFGYFSGGDGRSLEVSSVELTIPVLGSFDTSGDFGDDNFRAAGTISRIANAPLSLQAAVTPTVEGAYTSFAGMVIHAKDSPQVYEYAQTR